MKILYICLTDFQILNAINLQKSIMTWYLFQQRLLNSKKFMLSLLKSMNAKRNVIE